MTEEHDRTTLEREAVELRAYGLYLSRGCEHGHDVEDWLGAEALLLLEAPQSGVEETGATLRRKLPKGRKKTADKP